MNSLSPIGKLTRRKSRGVRRKTYMKSQKKEASRRQHQLQTSGRGGRLKRVISRDYQGKRNNNPRRIGCKVVNRRSRQDQIRAKAMNLGKIGKTEVVPLTRCWNWKCPSHPLPKGVGRLKGYLYERKRRKRKKSHPGCGGLDNSGLMGKSYVGNSAQVR